MLTLVTICILFAFSSFALSRGVKGGSFFRVQDRSLNAVGLITANITAGTGFVYLLANGARNGVLACLLPLALLAGYRFLAWMLGRVPDSLFAPNFLQACAHAVERGTGTRSVLRIVLIAPLLVIFVLLLAFELFATSQLLAGLISTAAGIASQLMVAGVLFLTTLAVCFWGSEGMLRADRLQAGLIVVCLVCLLVMSINGWTSAPDHKGAFAIKTDKSVITALLFAAVGAFNTQLYSILNWNAVASVSGRDRRWLLTTASYFLAGFAFVVLAIGAGLPGTWGEGFGPALKNSMAGLPSAAATLLLVALTAGVAAITLTTTQGITMAVAAIANELQRNASAQPSAGRRLQYVVVLCVAMVVLGGFYYFRPSVFYLLLALVSGAEAVVPLIVLLLFLAPQPKCLDGLGNRWLWPYLLFFGAAVAVNLTLTVTAQELVPYWALTVLFISSLYSGWLYWMLTRKAFLIAGDASV